MGLTWTGYARAALVGVLVALFTGCASPQRGLESDVRTTLEGRSWPATSVLVVERGTLRMNLGHRTPPGRDPQDLVYPLGSMSKMFTAAAVHRPRRTWRGRSRGARGGVSTRLARGVAQRARAPAPRTTSGIPDFWFVPEAAKLASDPRARAEDLARVMARHPLQFEPGSRFSYSNTAYHAAARIIERTTGLSYDAYPDARVLRAARHDVHAPLSRRLCRDARPRAARGHVQAIANENYETARGDGGLCGSARDLARWFQAIAARR